MSDSLEADQIKNFEEKYDHITKAGLEENPLPLISPTNKKKRGRKKQSKLKNLLDRLISHKDDILRLMNYFDVPFDNN